MVSSKLPAAHLSDKNLLLILKQRFPFLLPGCCQFEKFSNYSAALHLVPFKGTLKSKYPPVKPVALIYGP
ncbi:MAG: hypothetical protein ABFS19_10595, partial [Thermodesulfobacteriota bacterium]